MKQVARLLIMILLSSLAARAAGRINQEGRILGPLPAGGWNNLLTTNGNSTNLPIMNTVEFFRVQGQ